MKGRKGREGRRERYRDTQSAGDDDYETGSFYIETKESRTDKQQTWDTES